jgi:hypothetical protein
MAMKLWEKVNIITGQSSKSRNLVPIINAGAKFVVSSLPEKFLWSIASETEVNGWAGSAAASASISEGSGIAYDKILAVYRQDGTDSNGNAKKRIAEEVSDKGIHIFDESSSLLKPTKMFPKFYKLSGKIYIKPAPDYNASSSTQSYTPVGGSSTNVTTLNGDKGVIVYAAPPETDENTDAWVLVEYENIVLYYAASLDMKRLCQSYRDTIATHLTTVTGTYLVNFESNIPTFSVSVPPSDPTLPSLSGSAINITMDTIPDYVVQTMTTIPSFPSIESLREEVMETMPSVTPSLTVSDYPSGMTGFPEAPILPVLTDMPSISNYPTLTMPTVPASGVISYTSPTDVLVTDFTVTGAPLPDFSLPQFTFDWTNVDDALTKAQNLIDTDDSVGGDDSGAAFDSAQEWLEDEDPEMVTSVLNTAAQEVSRAQASISKEQRKLEEYSQKSDAEMSRYQNVLTKYRAVVEKTTSELNNKIQGFNSRVQNEQMNMQSKVEQYQRDTEKYNTEVQAKVSEFERVANAKVQEFTSKSTSKINEFSALATSRVQEYSEEATSVINKFQAEASSHTAKYTAIEQVRMAEYSAKVQEKLGTYTQKATQAIGQFREKANAAISEWREKSNVYIQEYSAKVQEAVQKYQSKSGTAVSKFNAELQEAVQEEQRKTAEFNAKTNQVVQDYGAKIQKYTAIVGEETQKFNGSLQKSAQFLSEAAALMAIVGQLNTQCQMAMQESQDYYQRSVAELRAVSGVLTAPPQQQKEQRQEQGATS